MPTRKSLTSPGETSEPDPTFGRNRIAAEATINALRISNRLETIDSARITSLQALADAVDADGANASLWREYRAAEAALREVHDAKDTDETSAFLVAVSTPVGNPKNTRKGNARSAVHSGR